MRIRCLLLGHAWEVLPMGDVEVCFRCARSVEGGVVFERRAVTNERTRIVSRYAGLGLVFAAGLWLGFLSAVLLHLLLS